MRSLTLMCALVVAGCHRTDTIPGPDETRPQLADSGATYVPGATWRTASASLAGFDSARMETLKRDVTARRFGTVDGLVVIRYGHLVTEQYVGWSPTRAHTMQSVSKSVTSLLFGILQQRVPAGQASLDRPVVDIFPNYQPIANTDAAKRALTLRHMLMMRTGMDFWENPYAGSPLDQLNQSTGDWVRFILDRPMTGTPGNAWAYNSGAAILMCGVIRELAGTSADDFARRELFEPIGVTGEQWYRSPWDGLPHCGGGLLLKPLDMARIGYLVLRHGRWGDKQVVPSEWVDAATQPLSRGSSLIFAPYNPGYGYFWWTFPLRRGGTDASVIAASGSGGQWLFIIPSLDLVVAMTATDGAGLDLLYDGVLSAVR